MDILFLFWQRMWISTLGKGVFRCWNFLTPFDPQIDRWPSIRPKGGMIWGKMSNEVALLYSLSTLQPIFLAESSTHHMQWGDTATSHSSDVSLHVEDVQNEKFTTQTYCTEHELFKHVWYIFRHFIFEHHMNALKSLSFDWTTRTYLNWLTCKLMFGMPPATSGSWRAPWTHRREENSNKKIRSSSMPKIKQMQWNAIA